jgi:hypothetical protein
VAAQDFRSRAPAIALAGGVLSVGFIALAWGRGRPLDWMVFTPLAAVSGLLAVAAASGFVFRVGSESVEVRLLGLRLCRLPLAGVTQVEVDRVSAVAQHGGWGVRGPRANRAYLLGSGRGVRLRWPDRQVFLGYEDADALRDSIQRQGACRVGPSSRR